MNSRYINRKEAEASYRLKSGAMSEGLKRAREPYRIRNAATGIILGAFAVGVWAYSISAVKQDVFDDVDEEAKALQASSAGATQKVAHVLKEAVKEEKQIIEGAAAALEGKPLPADMPASTVHPPPRGSLQKLGDRYPWLLDPERKTLVWGAPPVDSIGKMGGKS